MNPLETFSQQLDLITRNSRVIYLRVTPEIPDFTVSKSCKILISGAKTKVELEISPSNAVTVAGILEASVFDKEFVDTVLTWNIKPFLTYLGYYLSRLIQPSNSLIDLNVIENFLGIPEKPPENLSGAVNRSKRIATYKSWKKVYQTIHLPLILRILPQIETTPLLNEVEKTANYSYYEIEGQKNGRLKCHKAYNRGYVPHTMGDDVKKNLKPRGYENIFMYADINNCEVSVLQWLSQDPSLTSILSTGQDVYSQIYKLITGDDCDTDKKRIMCKLMFLPVIYGCGAKGLSGNLNIPEDTCRELIKRIHIQFATAIGWVLSKQKEFENDGVVVDYHGRPRTNFEKVHKVRNFVVQAPAATICLEKLILIADAIKPLNAKVAFTVHDGYGVICTTENAKQAFEATKQCVEAESKLCPGLKLGFHAEFGRKLINMKTFWR